MEEIKNQNRWLVWVGAISVGLFGWGFIEYPDNRLLTFKLSLVAIVFLLLFVVGVLYKLGMRGPVASMYTMARKVFRF